MLVVQKYDENSLEKYLCIEKSRAIDKNLITHNESLPSKETTWNFFLKS